MGEALGQIGNRGTVELGQIGGQGRCSRLCLRHSLALLFPPCFQRFQFGFCRFGEDPGFDGGYHVRDFLFRPGEGGSQMAHGFFATCIQTPLMGGVTVRKFLDGFGLHQMLFEAVDDGLFQNVLAQALHALTDRAAFFSCIGTIKTAHAAACDVHRAAACSTPDQAREEVGRTTAGMGSTQMGGIAGVFLRTGGINPPLALSGRVPGVLVHDAQGRDLFDFPVTFGIQSRDASALAWRMDVAQPVPDASADIEFVIENTGAAFSVALDRIGPPGPIPTTRPVLGHRDPFGVQGCGDAAGRDTAPILRENAPDHHSLFWDNFKLSGLWQAVGLDGNSIAVRQAPCRASRLNPAAQPAMGFLGQLSQIDRVDRR
ncbi:hypothetical protein NKW43_07140 [Gluconobacter albidus]|nr:hypothetical protein [Gluconobacter albidus]MCP1273452.1 hypothetical protein [Gluconobacter albidus]